MKGIVFTEFLELVEDKFGFDIADNIIDKSNLPSEGVYTQVGIYNYQELIDLINMLSQETNIPVDDLVITFGHHLIAQFTYKFPQYFENINSTFEFLDTIENKVHVEVKKLYPDAQLPSFKTSFPTENTMLMIYTSERPFSSLAHGMMMGCADYFNDNIDISLEDKSEGNLTKVIFTLTKN